jgi:hypothetical protein
VGAAQRSRRRFYTREWDVSKADLCAHGATRCEPHRKGHGEPHADFDHRGMPCCKRCGHVKPRTGWLGTCIGSVRIELRETQQPPNEESAK